MRHSRFFSVWNFISLLTSSLWIISMEKFPKKHILFIALIYLRLMKSSEKRTAIKKLKSKNFFFKKQIYESEEIITSSLYMSTSLNAINKFILIKNNLFSSLFPSYQMSVPACACKSKNERERNFRKRDIF